jgi:membrane protein
MQVWRKITGLATIFKEAFIQWKAKDPFGQSAVIAYCAIFSLPGLLVLIITIAGYFFGHEAVSNHLKHEVSKAMGPQTAEQVNNMVAKAYVQSSSLLAGILGTLTIIIGATGVFAQMQSTLNAIWEVKPNPKKSGIWLFLKSRLFSFGLILSIGFLLLVSLVISSVLSSGSNWIRSHWPAYIMFLFNVINVIVSLGVTTILFALIFKILPDAKIKWRFVWIGSVLTAVLFEAGKALLGLYFGKTDPGEGYGPAGSIILILLWVSYSSTIVFFGAQFTRIYTLKQHGEVNADEKGMKA